MFQFEPPSKGSFRTFKGSGSHNIEGSYPHHGLVFGHLGPQEL